MKRKIFRVLTALVVVTSFSMVMAVPVAADTGPQFLDVVPSGVTTGEWSTTVEATVPQAGTYSYHVVLPADSSGAGLDIIHKYIYGPTGVGTMTLADITGMTFWEYVKVPGGTMQMGAGITLYMDMDDSGTFDWMNDAQIVLESPYPDDPLVLDNIDKWALRNITDFAGFQKGGGSLNADYTGVDGVALHCTLAEWQASAYATYPVLWVGIVAGWGDYGDYDGYFDDFIINGDTYVLEPRVINTTTPAGFSNIQAAIDAASPGDTISVAAGTYTEDLAIPTGKDNLELTPASGATVTIKGVETEPDASFPLAVPNIDVLSAGVKIHGFTIEGPDAVASEYASGMLIGASNVEIYDNDFKVTAGRNTWAGPVSTGIVTYRKTSIPTVDISGLDIHDNTFTNHGTGLAGFDAIFINLDTGTTTAIIADNEFTGNVARAISTERSNMLISGNSIVTDLAPYALSVGGYQGMYIGCFPVGSDPGPVQTDVSITGNTVKGATSSEGFAQGIRVGHTTQLGLTNITVSQNTVQDCDEGITVRADATGVTVSYNDITGNTVGVQNDDTGTTLDAEGNWYGGVAGPQHTDNPYNTQAATQVNDSVSDDVDFAPWMIHTSLYSGWNIFSTPIAADAATNTVAEALDFWTSDSSLVTAAYEFDSSTQTWATPTTLSPLEAVYVNLSGTATIDVLISDSNNAPPARTMHVGWNLVGPAELYDTHVDAALNSAYWGTGQTSLIGYNHVISPSIHQTTWTYLRDAGYVDEDFVPTEGYWVFMVNQGMLGGFTYTPIVP